MKHASDQHHTLVFRTASFIIAILVMISTLMANTTGGTGKLDTAISRLSSALFSTSSLTPPPQFTTSIDPIPPPPPPPKP